MWFKPFNFLLTEKRKKWMKAVVICTQCLIDSFKCEVRCYFQVLSSEVNHRPNIRFGIRFTDTFLCLSNMSVKFWSESSNTEVTECVFCGVMFSEFLRLNYFISNYWLFCGPGTVVVTATGYGLDGPGMESRWGRDFPHLSRPALVAHPASCTMGTGSFPGAKSGLGVTLTPHPLLVPWSLKSRAIPLLPLWAVRPVQSLSACTRVHFTLQ